MARGMVAVPKGYFVMGSDDHYPEERPAHSRQVDGFLIDEHPVTNADFQRFVRVAGYTTVAEQPPDPADFEDADAADLVGGSLVFKQTSGPVPLDDWRRWWEWVPGAWWAAPHGPGSSIGGREHHPVVHIAFEDALAYAQWAGKDLPSEIEWEYAARAGRPPSTYAWGAELAPRGRLMANTWHGRFPWEHLAPKGGPGTSAVGRYRANDWGLVDMIGNVWEWTTSEWTSGHAGAAAETAAPEPAEHACCAVGRDGPAPLRESDRRVMKGGSHLCAPSYCLRYRPAARQGQAVRSSTGHLGFRCVRR